MNKLKIITLFSIAFTTAAFADCETAEANLFTCTFENGAKRVEICMIETENEPRARYSFGATGQKPDLVLDFAFSEVAPDTGYSYRYHYMERELGYDGNAEYLVFDNGIYTYNAIADYYAVVEDNIYSLAFLKSASRIETLVCDPNSHHGSPIALQNQLLSYGHAGYIQGYWKF